LFAGVANGVMLCSILKRIAEMVHTVAAGFWKPRRTAPGLALAFVAHTLSAMG
jgi:hypothetical protein